MILTMESYLVWAGKHCEAFGFRDADLGMVLAWHSAFNMLGFGLGELEGATAAMLTSEKTPDYAPNHRRAVIQTITAMRQERAKKNTVVNTVGCDECDPLGANPPDQNTAEGERAARRWATLIARYGVTGIAGMRIMPHPGLGDDGRWYRTLRMPAQDPMGVKVWVPLPCLCESGQRIKLGWDRAERPHVTLSEYCAAYPNWAEVRDARIALFDETEYAEPSAEDVQRLHTLLADIRRNAIKKGGSSAWR